MNDPKDMSGKVKGDECGKHEPVGNAYPDGTSAGLGKDYGTKNDGELANDLVPSVRKTGSL
jgi:hypothetical protein